MGTSDDPSLTDGGMRTGMPGLATMTKGPRPVDEGTPSTEATLAGDSLGSRQASLDETVAGDEPALREELRAVEPGSVVGRHFLLQRLGAGGMGVVHAAYDPELDRKVALKLLRPGTAGPIARLRLLREAQALAKLSHPNVVAIHDVGTVGEQVWIAMEFVQGETLGAWLRTPRRWQEVLAVMRSAGKGLVAAHAVGLLHRDFKPDNVMVGDDGRVRVMDFGLARVRLDAPSIELEELAPPLPTHDTSSVQVTRAGAIVGTPGYMAPEQFGGGELSAAADQFAFCVTLWEALYGQRPFAGSTWMEISDNVVHGRLRAAVKGRSAPGWLRRACERGLASDPEARWPSMKALLEVLSTGRARARTRRRLAAVGVLVLLGGSAEGWRRWDLARHAAACEASGAEIEAAWSPARAQALREALLATGVSHAATTADKTIPWLEQQAAAWREARAQACLDADVRGEWSAETLDRSLWCLDERRMELESLVDELTVADAEVLAKAVAAAAGLSAIAPCLDERALEVLAPPPAADREAIRAVRADVTRASNLERAGRYPKGLELARDALARAEALEWRPLSAAARQRVGSLLEKTAAYPEAETMLADAYFEAAEIQATEVAFDAANVLVLLVGHRLARYAEARQWGRLGGLALTSLHEGEGLRRASLLFGLALVEDSTGARELARDHGERALAIREAELGPYHPSVAASLKNLGNTYVGLGSYARAAELTERSVAVYEQALGSDHPDVAFALLALARIHSVNGAPQAAMPLLERALAIAEPALGAEHPHVAAILNNLARTHTDLAAYEPAERLQARALAIFEKKLGPEHPNVAACLTDLARVHLATAAYDRALPLLERALAINEKAFGPDHSEVAKSLAYIAALHDATGAYDQAIPTYERALSVFEKALGRDHPDVAHCVGLLGLAYMASGAHDRAAPLFERALAIEEETLGPTHPLVSGPLVSLAKVRLAQGRPGEAVPLAERAVTLAESGRTAEYVAEARFVLARALWDAPAEGSRNRTRAMALAGQALEGARGDGKERSEQRVEIEAWQREHSLETAGPAGP